MNGQFFVSHGGKLSLVHTLVSHMNDGNYQNHAFTSRLLPDQRKECNKADQIYLVVSCNRTIFSCTEESHLRRKNDHH